MCTTMPGDFSVLKKEPSLSSTVPCVFSCVGDTTIKRNLEAYRVPFGKVLDSQVNPNELSDAL